MTGASNEKCKQSPARRNAPIWQRSSHIAKDYVLEATSPVCQSPSKIAALETSKYYFTIAIRPSTERSEEEEDRSIVGGNTRVGPLPLN